MIQKVRKTHILKEKIDSIPTNSRVMDLVCEVAERRVFRVGMTFLHISPILVTRFHTSSYLNTSLKRGLNKETFGQV